MRRWILSLVWAKGWEGTTDRGVEAIRGEMMVGEAATGDLGPLTRRVLLSVKGRGKA